MEGQSQSQLTSERKDSGTPEVIRPWLDIGVVRVDSVCKTGKIGSKTERRDESGVLLWPRQGETYDTRNNPCDEGTEVETPRVGVYSLGVVKLPNVDLTLANEIEIYYHDCGSIK